MRRRPPRRLAVALLLGLAGPSAAQEHPAAYVGSGLCADCHAEAAERWRGSHHAKAWMTVTPDTVIADFTAPDFLHAGTRTRFLAEDGGFAFEVTETDGRTTRYEVAGVAGIAPLQQYLLDTGDGRLQSFDVVWDDVAKRWYHLYPEQDLAAEDGLHWTGPYKNWNARCAECHATGFQKAYDPRTRRYQSRAAEIGVGCESCHGPGSAHLEWAESGTAPPPSLAPAGFDPALADPANMVAQCAGCHARREAHGPDSPLPGTPFHDSYRLALLRPGLYHADGQILDEVYVYGSFLQSKMAARGVVCMDCHLPHAAELRAEGNAVCTQCHSPSGNPDFPTLRAALYDDPAHHFHEAGGPGAECVDCHMIERVYMGIDGRRDHSFRVPRPDLAAETGAPDACTDCHDERDSGWAADLLAGWYPESRHRGPHYGQTLAAGRQDPRAAAAALTELALAEDMPGIVRASALELLANAPDAATATATAGLLADEDPLVRAAALAVQRGASPMDGLLRAAALADDPVRDVRIAAARALLDRPLDRLREAERAALAAAFGDWQAALTAKADFPETHMAIGGSALVMRNPEAALGAFGEAARLDPQLIDAWMMQGRIRAALGDVAGTRRVLEAGLAANPGNPALLEATRALPR